MVSHLWDIIDKLRDELNIASDGINDLNDVIKDLQAVNDKDGLYDEVKELQAENKALKEQVNDLMIDKDRLVKQVSSNRGSNSTSHTIQREIDEYMSHNDKCKDARLFLLPIESFDERGDWDGSLYWDDGISS